MLMILRFILSVTRHMICGNKELELASELESDLQGTVHWGKKWLVDFNAGKFQENIFHLCQCERKNK